MSDAAVKELQDTPELPAEESMNEAQFRNAIIERFDHMLHLLGVIAAAVDD
jgi:hypothetical protein